MTVYMYFNLDYTDSGNDIRNHLLGKYNLGEKMNTSDIIIDLETKDLENIMNRYHFSDTDFFSLQALSRSVAPLLQPKAYYIWKEKKEPILYEDYAVVFLTLGNGVDELQDVYLNRQCLSEAYMIECIAMEALTQAYEIFVKKVQAERGKWAAKIDFLGDTYPMELLPELYEGFEQMEITFSEQLVLSPKKSVVFLLPMSEHKMKNPCHICENCGNTECLFREESKKNESRKLLKIDEKKIFSSQTNTYGYQRIFGKKNE